jgi:plasmid segregation protein ParM
MSTDVLVVDLGFSSAKYMYLDQKGRVPSGYRSMAGGYLYGEEAMIKSGSSYLKTPEELLRHYPEFVSICRKKAGVPDDVRVRLAVGLPYLFWEMENRPGGSVEKLADSLRGENVEDVFVLPQGLGGVKSYLDTTDGVKGNILAVDIGFNTVIFTLFSADEGKIIYGNTFNKRGIHQMAVDHVLPRIAHLAPARTFTPLETGILVERGEFQYGFDVFDIKGEISQSAQEYFPAIIDDIYGEIQAESGTYATAPNLLLFGGGASIMDGVLPEKTRFTILPEPEYANARGFSLLAAG